MEPGLRGGDPLLQLAHLRGQGGLVAHRRRHPSQESGHFASRLGEAEDVVHEEQHVEAVVAEVLGHGEPRKRHAEARSRRLVHLPEDEAGLLQYLRLRHLPPQVVSLAGALTDTGEDGVTAVLRGDVVDELLDDDGLADSRPAEEAGLPALHVGAEQVDDLDPRLEDLRLGLQLREGNARAVDRHALLRLRRSLAVNGLAQQVEHPAQDLGAHGHGDRGPGVDDACTRGGCRRWNPAPPRGRGFPRGAAGLRSPAGWTFHRAPPR